MHNEAIKVCMNFRVESTPFHLERVKVNSDTTVLYPLNKGQVLWQCNIISERKHPQNCTKITKCPLFRGFTVRTLFDIYTVLNSI